MKRIPFLPALALCAGAALSMLNAACAASLDTGAAANSAPIRVVLAVDAADAPQPVLRYSLFHDVFDQVPGNAAVAYDRAARLIVQAEQWKEDRERCGEWLGLPLDQLPEKEAEALLQRHAAALNQLVKATLYERCDWEIPVRSEGAAAMLPHLSEMRAAARLLALDIRLCIRQGRFDDAITRLRAGFTLARHVGDGSLLIEGLVGVAIARQMLERVEDFIRQPAAPNLYWALTDLPPAYLSVWRATLWERSFLNVHLPLLRESSGRSVTAADLRRAVLDFHNPGFIPNSGPWTEDQAALAVAGAGWLAYPIARQGLAARGVAAAELESLPAPDVLTRYVAGGYLRQRDNFFKWFSLPYPVAEKGLARASAELEAAIIRDPIENILVQMFLPALGRVSVRFAELEREFAALRCVESVRFHAARHQHQLPASLDIIREMPASPDPMTALPFDYRVEGGTAVLRPPSGMEETSARKSKIYEITIRQ